MAILWSSLILWIMCAVIVHLAGGMEDLVCTDKRSFLYTRPYRGRLKFLSCRLYDGEDTVEADSDFGHDEISPPLGISRSQQHEPGWEGFGQREFKFFNTISTWEESETACINERAHLASVHSLPEYQFIKQIISIQTQDDVSTWLGGFDFGIVDRWYWIDCTPFDFSYWAPGQPDGSGHCMQMNYKGGMDDVYCTKDKRSFVCARPYRGGLKSSLSGHLYDGEDTVDDVSAFGHDEVPPPLESP